MIDASAKGDLPSLSSEASGLSQFVMRVLDQLSLTSWLPSTFVVGSSFLLLKLDSQSRPDVSTALENLSNQSFGVLVVLFFAMIIAAMIIQAFEFTAIRFLEGYWPSLFSWLGVTWASVRFQRWTRRRRLNRVKRLRKRAFRAAREGLLDVGEVPEVLQYLQGIAYGEVKTEPPGIDVLEAARASRWETYVPATMLRSLEAAERASKGYPAPHRIMPTRLGNTLRSAEDDLRLNGSESLRTFVLRRWHLLGDEQRRLHNEYRNRLDLYCSMVMTCAWGATLGVAAFLTGTPKWQAAVVALLVFGGLMLVCYRAAITAAQGYGGALHVVRDHTQTDAARGDRTGT